MKRLMKLITLSALTLFSSTLISSPVFAAGNLPSLSGTRIIIPKALSLVESVDDLSGASICFVVPSKSEIDVANYFRVKSMNYEPIPTADKREARSTLLVGDCDILAVSEADLETSLDKINQESVFAYIVLPRLDTGVSSPQQTNRSLPASRTIASSGTRLIISKSLRVQSATRLNNATVCVEKGSINAANVAHYFRAHSMRYRPVNMVGKTQLEAAYLAGRCSVLAVGAPDVNASLGRINHRGGYFVLSDNIE